MEKNVVPKDKAFSILELMGSATIYTHLLQILLRKNSLTISLRISNLQLRIHPYTKILVYGQVHENIRFLDSNPPSEFFSSFIIFLFYHKIYRWWERWEF